MTAPEGEPSAEEATKDSVSHTPLSYLDRLLQADRFEEFLGIPPGGHRDPSPGETLPRWPDVLPPKE